MLYIEDFVRERCFPFVFAAAVGCQVFVCCYVPGNDRKKETSSKKRFFHADGGQNVLLGRWSGFPE